MTDRPMNWAAAGGYLRQEATDTRAKAANLKDAPQTKARLTITADLCDAVGRALIFGATGQDKGAG
jgi:hypothetical protein